MDSSVKPAPAAQKEEKAASFHVAAFSHDEPLSPEAAAQLVKMASDPSTEAHKGKELDTISEAELLSKLG
jgi:hypothetical protein